MRLFKWLCAPALGLAAALLGASTIVSAQTMPLAERIAQCGSCHGEDGNSRLPDVPSLAGQPAFFVMNQLFLMREGVRRIEVMTPIVKELTDSDLEALSAHYAQLAPKASDEVIDPAMVKHGDALAQKLRCASCHLPTLAGQDQMPRLARQRVDYLFSTMKAMRDNQRPGTDTQMSSIVAGLSDADLTALAHYSSSR